MLHHQSVSCAASNALKHLLWPELLLETAVFYLMFLAQKPSSGSRHLQTVAGAMKNTQLRQTPRRSSPVSCFAAFQARTQHSGTITGRLKGGTPVLTTEAQLLVQFELTYMHL